MVTRVKTKAEVELKMKDRVGTAGKYLKSSLEQAEDPLDVILSDPDKYIDDMVKGIMEAKRTGKIESGIRKAKDRDAWKKSIPRAGAHYEERTDDMVKNSLEDYNARRDCIQKTVDELAKMPKTTRSQRIARSAWYQEQVGKCFDGIYGRTE